MIVMMEKLVESTVLTGETKILGENLPRRHFVHHKSHLPDPGANPDRRGGKRATNRFSYGAARLLRIFASKTEEHQENVIIIQQKVSQFVLYPEC
jgi:hypothetical protein